MFVKEEHVETMFILFTPELGEDKPQCFTGPLYNTLVEYFHRTIVWVKDSQVKLWFSIQSKEIVQMVKEILISNFANLCLVVFALCVNGNVHWASVAVHCLMFFVVIIAQVHLEEPRAVEDGSSSFRKNASLQELLPNPHLCHPLRKTQLNPWSSSCFKTKAAKMC